MAEKQQWHPGFLGVLLVLMFLVIAMAIYFGKQKTARENASAEKNESFKTDSPAPRNPLRTGKKNSSDAQIIPAATDSSVAQLLAQLNDSSLPTKIRRAAGRALARTASAEALGSVRDALKDSGLPPAVKAAIVEGLGENSLTEARTVLENLISDKDETIARAAVRGLAQKGDAEAADMLFQILADAQKPESVRTEAALALGEVNQPNVTASLIKAMSEIKDENISEFILEGIGQRPFGETEDFFRAYLASPNVSSDLRVAAIDALANSPGNPTSLLMRYATDPDPDVRMAIGFSLASTDEQGAAGGELLGLMAEESDPQVRAKFYQAMENQSDVDFMKAFAMVKGESDIGVKLAGLDLLAGAAKSNPDIAAYFTQTALAELKSAALSGQKMQDRLAATLTLRKLNNPSSLTMLQEIAGQSTDPKVTQAAQAALKSQSR